MLALNWKTGSKLPQVISHLKWILRTVTTVKYHRKLLSSFKNYLLDFVFQIASAVYHCHLFNVAHRDLKPENLLLLDKSEVS